MVLLGFDKGPMLGLFIMSCLFELLWFAVLTHAMSVLCIINLNPVLFANPLSYQLSYVSCSTSTLSQAAVTGRKFFQGGSISLSSSAESVNLAPYGNSTISKMSRQKSLFPPFSHQMMMDGYLSGFSLQVKPHLLILFSKYMLIINGPSSLLIPCKSRLGSCMIRPSISLLLKVTSNTRMSGYLRHNRISYFFLHRILFPVQSVDRLVELSYKRCHEDTFIAFWTKYWSS